MEFVAALAAWAFGAISSPAGFSSSNLALRSNTVASELGPLLSKNAAIFTPGSTGFTTATDRWSATEQPGISVVVQVASENDVSQTIIYANKKNIPYLAVGRGHGDTDTLSQVKNGIQIWTTGLDTITVAPDGKSATIQGGVQSKQVTDALWAVKKQTVTGFCECTGIAGPALGGGHGILQGRHGLVSDQLIEARIVLANGTAITASTTCNPDLYWAVKGAGHNFGVVTSFKLRIYDVPAGGDNWTYQTLIFTQDKLEGVYSALNKLSSNGTQSEDLMNFSLYTRVTAIDPPVIILFILYANSPSEFDKAAAPFHALNPIVADSGLAEYPQLPAVTGNGLQNSSCAHGSSWQRFPIGLQEYNVPAQRALYTAYANLTTQVPGLNNSAYIFEGYPVVGVKAIPEASSAYPNRADNLLLSAFMTYAPNPALDPVAAKFGVQARELLQAASGSPKELHAYVNYAHGDEGLESWYGYDQARLNKLQTLKKQFDPLNKFSFYGPIA